MRRARILMLLTDGFGGFGGISRFNRDFLGALDASWQVDHVLALPRLITQPIEETIPETVIYDRRAAKGLFAFTHRVLASLARERPDLVICGHINLLPFAWLVARASGAKLALIIHGIDAWWPTKRRVTNVLARSVDRVVSVSGYTAERFAAWSGVPGSYIHILPNCVDLNRFSPGEPDPELRRRYGLGGSRVLLTVGRLASAERYKGFDEVIECLDEVSKEFDLKYLIAGDGPDRQRLERKVQDLALSDRVVFAGQILEAEKVAHYDIADVYVMPSSGEGFGIVLIEAAGCGLAIIGSKADGSREALRDGLLGTLVDPSSREELVSALKAALRRPRSRSPIAGVEVFDVPHFRARVHGWLETEIELAGEYHAG